MADSDFRKLRRRAGFRSIVGVALAAGVFLAANALSFRFPLRGDLSRHVAGGLSAAARARLTEAGERLEENGERRGEGSGRIEVIAFFRHESPLRKPARRLLRALAECAAETEGLNRTISVEAVDANHDVARAETLLRRWPELRPDSLLVAREGRRPRVLGTNELTRPSSRGEGTVFAGEGPCVDAVLSLLVPDGAPARFLSGDGETDPVEDSAFRRLLESAGFSPAEAEPDDPLPEPGEAWVVVDGPRVAPSPARAAALAAFLREGGRALLLLDAASAEGFRPVWDATTIRPRLPDHGPGAAPPRPASSIRYGGHPVAIRLHGVATRFSAPLLFDIPPPADEEESADKPSAEALVLAPGPEGDGGAALAAAAEIPGTGVSGRPGRLVVVGDARFASGPAMETSPGNAALLRAAAAWLAEP